MVSSTQKIIAASFVAGLFATSAQADIEVDFRESAPKDRFTITNTGTCDIGPATITVNLDGSAGALFFDTTGAGDGVEVFQPFETVAGATHLKATTAVSDGDTQVTLTLNGLPANQAVGFTIDVDDRLEQSARGQIIVTGGEISGASVSVDMPDLPGLTAAFEGKSSAIIRTKGCLSQT